VKPGTENRKGVIALGILGVVLAGLLYYNYFDSPSTPTPAATRVAQAPAGSAQPEEFSSSRTRKRSDEFLPALHHKSAERNAEPLPADPTLRLDLLAKLNDVPAAGSRDLFTFGKAEPVKLAGAEPVIAVKPWAPIGPPRYTPPPKPAGPPQPPPPPPINLKYYGICTTRPDGLKTAFFMDGDDILIEAEGATFKGRYKLVRIGVNSAVVEDVQYKHEQTLPLAEDAQPGAGE
jgi:hypothetical protein